MKIKYTVNIFYLRFTSAAVKQWQKWQPFCQHVPMFGKARFIWWESASFLRQLSMCPGPDWSAQGEEPSGGIISCSRLHSAYGLIVPALHLYFLLNYVPSLKKHLKISNVCPHYKASSDSLEKMFSQITITDYFCYI